MNSSEQELFELLCSSDAFRIRFGDRGYCIEDETEQLPYSTMLTALLNVPSPENRTMAVLQTQYAAFLDELYSSGGRKREPLILRACKQVQERVKHRICPPRIEIQYEVIQLPGHETELVETMYFCSVSDFIYVELLKGLQKGFVPKRCLNCGRWFLQIPGPACSYCSEPAPGEGEKTCREIGAASSFRSKIRSNEIWQIHQRAYKKYFARTKKNTMSKSAFADWVLNAEKLRDEALKVYDTVDAIDRMKIVEALRTDLNKL